MSTNFRFNELQIQQGKNKLQIEQNKNNYIPEYLVKSCFSRAR